MYEDLLRELKCCPDAEYGCSRCNHKDSLHCRETLMQESADAIEKLTDELSRRPQWISVKERLPEIWVKVLSFQPTFDGRGIIRSAVYIGSYKWRETEYHNMMELPVTHWMPLPDPPKEVNDGN